MCKNKTCWKIENKESYVLLILMVSFIWFEVELIFKIIKPYNVCHNEQFQVQQ